MEGVRVGQRHEGVPPAQAREDAGHPRLLGEDAVPGLHELRVAPAQAEPIHQDLIERVGAEAAELEGALGQFHDWVALARAGKIGWLYVLARK